jgi:hypothetical protein
MFTITNAVKTGFNSLSKNNIRYLNKKVTINMVQFDEKFKTSVSNFLKYQNIKNFSMTFNYCPENLYYTGIISAYYFTQEELNNINNELDYYVKMSNEFAYKN